MDIHIEDQIADRSRWGSNLVMSVILLIVNIAGGQRPEDLFAVPWVGVVTVFFTIFSIWGTFRPLPVTPEDKEAS